ncbi:hypothetical protein AAFF_G00083150 [Aldrovandia affinis]|uniref:Apoptosis facilitator Bcl-2-like protein 14 n=1 Tax=Aldrovandia affinis TaxID=143900 RepID=A0AAD7RXC8_9TELE|nr:hypothetical protein AAFF_G00083150 [Aldrovandia affinis]
MKNGGVSREVAGAGEDSVEFRVLMAYAQRRRPSNARLQQPSRGDALPPSPKVPARKRKKASRLRKLLLACVRPQGEPREQDGSEEPMMAPQFRALGLDVGTVADRLSSIVDSVDLSPGDIEVDGPDDVIDEIVKILRESGDQLNRKIQENEPLARQFRSGFSYSLFEAIANLFLQEVAPCVIPNTMSPQQAKIALICEVTSKLTTVDNHPMNKVMGFGAKYLQENFSTWVQQHGGWEKAIGGEEDEIE